MNAEFDNISKKRKPRKKDKKFKELKRLEKLVFGVPSRLFDDIQPSLNKKKKHHRSDETDHDKKLQPVWEDEDDLTVSIKTAHEQQGRPDVEHPGKPNDCYDSLLKRRFENILGNPKWAEIKSESDKNDDSLLQRCGNFLEKQKDLASGTINFSTLKELNAETLREGKVIKAVEFHPKSLVALVAGLSGIATLFEVNGKSNPKIQMVRFPKFDIYCAKFTHEGDRFIVGSKIHRHYYSYDMMSGRSTLIPVHHETGITNMENFEVSSDGKVMAVCGRFGNIFLISVKTNECIGTLKMNGGVNSISFSSNGSRLYSHGDDGHVYVWDMNSRVCIHKFLDDGCLKGTSICISPDDQLLACGSSSGAINLYETSSVMNSENPRVLKTLLNLTTEVSSLKFNHSSEILAMASVKKDKAIKLMHYPSLTVYKNFPDQSKSTGLINCVSFSPHSGYLAMGTNFKKVPLYRLNYFGSY